MKRSNKRLILSNQDNEVIRYLRNLGYDLIFSETIDKLLPFERKHADMQCLIHKDTAFVLKESSCLIKALSDDYRIFLTQKDISSKYPDNILLNTLLLDKYIIGKLEYTDRNLLEYAEKKGLLKINVKQGYTRCSCAVVNGDSIITEDESIANALKDTDVSVLKIQKGHVALQGADCGFIGGASGLIDDNTLFFTGDISEHPDYLKILDFCNERDVNVRYIKNKKINDIGKILMF